MKQKDYHTSVIANVGAREAFDKISRVSDWWNSSVRGNSRTIGDAFTVRFGETFVNFKVVEIIADQRVVWLVTNSNLHWLKNKTEWNGTKIVWEVSPDAGRTRVSMTHVGLVPDIECYTNCAAGWNFYVTESLLKLLTEGKGRPGEERKVVRR